MTTERAFVFSQRLFASSALHRGDRPACCLSVHMAQLDYAAGVCELPPPGAPSPSTSIVFSSCRGVVQLFQSPSSRLAELLSGRGTIHALVYGTCDPYVST